MRRTGNDEIEGRALPEEQIVQVRIIEEIALVVQVFLIFRIIFVGVVLVVAHSRLKNTPAVERGFIVMEDLGGIAIVHKLGSHGLVKMIGHIIKDIMAVGRQINAGICAEFRVQRPGATVEGGVEIGEVDAFLHEAGDGGSIFFIDHPVIHGFHQYQHHILAFENAGHGVILHFSPLFKKCIYRFHFGAQFNLVTGQGRIDLMLPEVPEGQLVNATNIIHTLGIVHGIVSGPVGGRLAVLRMSTPNVVIPDKQGLGQQEQTHHSCRGRHQTGDPGAHPFTPVGPKNDHQRALGQQHHRTNPPESRKTAQHIPQENRTFIQIEQIRQPHNLAEGLVITGLADGPAGHEIIADTVSDSSCRFRKPQHHCGQQQRPGAAKGKNHPVAGLEHDIRKTFHQEIGQHHRRHFQPGQGRCGIIILFSLFEPVYGTKRLLWHINASSIIFLNYHYIQFKHPVNTGQFPRIHNIFC